MNICTQDIPGHVLALAITGTIASVFLFGWTFGQRVGYWAGRRAGATLATTALTNGAQAIRPDRQPGQFRRDDDSYLHGPH